MGIFLENESLLNMGDHKFYVAQPCLFYPSLHEILAMNQSIIDFSESENVNTQYCALKTPMLVMMKLGDLLFTSMKSGVNIVFFVLL